jgi:hypothetical protein
MIPDSPGNGINVGDWFGVVVVRFVALPSSP